MVKSYFSSERRANPGRKHHANVPPPRNDDGSIAQNQRAPMASRIMARIAGGMTKFPLKAQRQFAFLSGNFIDDHQYALRCRFETAHATSTLAAVMAAALLEQKGDDSLRVRAERSFRTALACRRMDQRPGCRAC